MVLEATMIVIDNSEFMRNGDFAPSRFEAQSDAVSVIFGAKTQSNPENTVGVMSMAGKSPQVLVTPTQDIGKVLGVLHALQIHGSADLSTSIQIAQLALKHRQNKNQRQRIIVFVGSPLEDDEKSLVKLGKRLKKNNVSIDVISFGEEESNGSRLRALVDSVSSNDSSHLVSIAPGPHLLSDTIVSSPILGRGVDDTENPSQGGEAPATGEGNFEFGVDPTVDPELAMALRLSMQEEQARRDASSPQLNTNTIAAVGTESQSTKQTSPASNGLSQVNDASMEEDEEAELAKALALSQGNDDIPMADEADLNEQEEIARAIRLSNLEPDDQEKDKN